MSDVPKTDVVAPPSEVKGGHVEVDPSQRENAVGYNEYLEARDLEFSGTEVRELAMPVLPDQHHGVSG